jgi:hypothetical protein
MNTPLVVTVIFGLIGLVIALVRLVVAYLAWRHPRAAPSSPPAENQEKGEEETGEGLAMVLGLLLAARNRGKARTQGSADSN